MTALDVARIQRETFIVDLEVHEELDSTNTRALNRAAELSHFPWLILAERQTAGRGRGNNTWWTGAGALTFSLLLRSTDYAIPSTRSPMVSLTAGLAVAEAVSQFVPASDVRLKWPNDVYLNGRKACGILLETSSRQPGVIVLGIGLNVNNSLAQAPENLQAIATSLCDVVGASCDRTSILISMLQSLETDLLRLKNDPSDLADSWRDRCYLQGRTVQVQTGTLGSRPDGTVTGVCQGIDNDGCLLLQTETGMIRCLSGVVARIL